MKKLLLPLGISVAVIIMVYLFFQSFETTAHSKLESFQSRHWSYSLCSFLLLVSDIVLPVPSSIVMYMNGFVLGILTGALLSFVSTIIMCFIGYLLGFMAQRNKNAEPNSKANELLDRFGPVAIIITRPIPILAESICIVCGYNKMSLKKYLYLNATGYLPVCLLYSVFGSLGKGQNNFLLAFSASLALSGLFWFAGKQLLVPANKD